ncbi:MAG: DUF1491 family protein [Bdellovibrionales bacterium]|jgi:hypothetical protein
MSDDLPTDLLIAAQSHIAAQSGVSMIVTHKGDPSNGALFLKINKLDGTAHVYNQVRLDGEKVWVPALSTDATPEKEADRYLAEQIAFDPDLWVIEVEDRQGRLWFTGRIMDSL